MVNRNPRWFSLQCTYQHLYSIGDYGKMVSLRGTRVEAVPITASLEEQKKVDPVNDQMVLAARMVGTIFGDEDADTVSFVEKS